MLIDCGCDNRKDIMFTRGNGHVPVAAVAVLAVIVVIIYRRS